MTLDWPSAYAAGPARSGGKGWALARLARYGFPVPDGGVVEADIYRGVMAGMKVPAVGADDVLREDVAGQLEDVRKAILAASLPVGVREALVALLERLGGPVAVRSSAVGEDGEGASFAGVHSSVLSVSGLPGVERAVLACFASLWTPHAIAYRRRLGLSDDAVACAVAVCRMVGARCAGVAFSCDPLDGRRDVVIVEAAAGLGESVVSGRVTPDRVEVRRERGDWRVARGSGLLPDAAWCDLAYLVARAHQAFGEGAHPQDVEWAHDGERHWLVQVRPVVRPPRFTFEGVRGVPVYWSRANIQDTLPGIVAWYSWSWLQDWVGDVLYAPLVVAGTPPPHGLEIVRRFHGRGYFDFSGLQWAFYDGLGLLPAETMRSIGGHHPLVPVPPGKAITRVRLAARLRLFRAFLGLQRQMREVGGPAGHELRRLARLDLRGLSTDELGRLVRRLHETLVGVALVVGLANTYAGAGQDLLEQLLRPIVGERALGLMAGLLADGGGVTSAEHGYRLWELAAMAREDAPALSWLRSGTDACTWETLEDGPFRRALAAYLDEFGHRSTSEADVATPRWVEDPTYILDQVRALVAEGGRPPRERARAARMAAERELAGRTRFRRPLVRWMVKHAQKGFALREHGKSLMISGVLPSRRIALEIGRRLVEAGFLERPEDAFRLSLADVECWMRGLWDGRGAASLAADRAALEAAWAAEEAPEVMVEEAGRMAVHAAPVVEGASSWKGLGVAIGTAEGAARLLRRPSEGARLGAGDVLVTPSTDPGWTPLFVRASALVMETGGFLSHGAIVAREYGIPAVVNIPGIMASLPDGARIRVDGDAGVVTTSWKDDEAGPPSEAVGGTAR